MNYTFQFGDVFAAWPLLLKGTWNTIELSLLAMLLAVKGRTLAAFVASSLAIIGIIGTAGVSLFPFVMPSSTDLRSSLTVWDSVSSQLTLSIMLWATVIFMPLIIAYTSWAYKVMSGKVTAAYIRENEHAAY